MSDSCREFFGMDELSQFQEIRRLATTYEFGQVSAHLDRMSDELQNDSRRMIGAAKDLVETVSKSILAATHCTAEKSWNTPRLCKEACRAVLADDAALTATNRIVGGLSSVIDGLSQLRNEYGTGHGPDARIKDLPRRYGLMAAGSALTWATFLLQAYDAKEVAPPAVLRRARKLRDLLSNADASVHDRIHACEQLGQIGPNAREAIPSLFDALRDDNSEIQSAAIEALGKVGHSVSEVVSTLIDVLDRVGERWFLMHKLSEALGRMGSAAVSSLRKALGSSCKEVRIISARSLALIGPDAKDAVPDLVTAVCDEDGEVRREAVVALGRIRSHPERSVPALMRALDDDSSSVRGNACAVLGVFGAEAEQAVPRVTTLLQDKEADMCRDAACALGGIGAKATSATASLGLALEHQDKEVRQAAARALGRVEPEAELAVPALIKALHDDYVLVRRHAAWSLGKLGTVAILAIPALEGLQEDREPSVRKEAAVALERLRGQ